MREKPEQEREREHKNAINERYAVDGVDTAGGPVVFMEISDRQNSSNKGTDIPATTHTHPQHLPHAHHQTRPFHVLYTADHTRHASHTSEPQHHQARAEAHAETISPCPGRQGLGQRGPSPGAAITATEAHAYETKSPFDDRLECCRGTGSAG